MQQNDDIMKYIIEHMDPQLWEWSILEYRHVSGSVGKDSLIITNVKKDNIPKLKGYADVHNECTAKLSLKKVCILDPAAEKTLEPNDSNNFDYLVFGGILGNDPPEARTKDLVVPGAERRNLGKDQFSTDNAVMVAKLIIDGMKFASLKFLQDFVIEMDDGEEIILPYKYVLVNGKPYISEDIIEYVKKHGF
jgi:ribosome biogenesis SPOUT family RNA methylase Rps3